MFSQNYCDIQILSRGVGKTKQTGILINNILPHLTGVASTLLFGYGEKKKSRFKDSYFYYGSNSCSDGKLKALVG